MFAATASARSKEKDFAGSIPFEFSVVYGSGQFREALLVSGGHLRSPEIVSFREVHDRHRDVDPVHIAFRIHADRAAVIRGVRWSSGHRRNALIDMFASASGIECKTRFRLVVSIASAEHIHLIGDQNLEDVLIDPFRDFQRLTSQVLQILR